jgi:LacI family transcriptional regulator
VDVSRESWRPDGVRRGGPDQPQRTSKRIGSGGRRVTIRDVADAAGVSFQTVSRVLNERPDVAPETYRRIRAIIDEVGYAPNQLARSLIRGRSHVLGVVAYGLDYFGPSRILAGIDRQAGALGYTISLDLIREPETDAVEPLLSSLLARQVDGIVWAIPPVSNNRVWTRRTDLDVAVPVVLVGGPARVGPLATVSIDNRAIGRIATDHLIATGARHVGIVTGPMSWWEARERKAGWEDAQRARGVAPDADAVVEGDWTPESGRFGIISLLERAPTVDAVFVSNDQMAAGVLHAAHMLGRRIPDDLAIVGVDNVAESSHYWPPLTTVQQPLQEAGARAVEAIHHALVGSAPDGSPGPVGVPTAAPIEPHLIVRDSTRRPEAGVVELASVSRRPPPRRRDSPPG